jgi:Ca2+-binding EF-hand superfamily protein
LFRSGCSTAALLGKRRKRESYHLAKTIFEKMDLDNNGQICADEAKEHLRLNNSTLDLNSVISEMDSNGDGVIQPHEFDHNLKEIEH